MRPTQSRAEMLQKSGVNSTPMVLFFIFMTLRLVGSIDWSWWWITAPIWGSVGCILLLALLPEPKGRFA